MVPGGFELLDIRALPEDDPQDYHRRDLIMDLAVDAPSGEPRVWIYGGVFSDGDLCGFVMPETMVVPIKDEGPIHEESRAQHRQRIRPSRPRLPRNFVLAIDQPSLNLLTTIDEFRHDDR